MLNLFCLFLVAWFNPISAVLMLNLVLFIFGSLVQSHFSSINVTFVLFIFGSLVQSHFSSINVKPCFVYFW